MRDRLIQLISECSTYTPNYAEQARLHAEYVAQHLLNNGVIVPPCKYGDTIFVIPSDVNCRLNMLHNMPQNNRVYEQVIDHIIMWRSDYMLYTCDGLCAVTSKEFKNTWFLTREEAEKALAERSENGT